MRVAVMGAGSLGGFYGALLARAGDDVTLIARGKHLDAIRANGITVKSKLAGDFTVPIAATDEPASIGPVDLLFFCVKAFDLDQAAEAVRPLIGPETVVLPVQNGIDNEERLARVVGDRAVVGAAVYVSNQIAAPGVVVQSGGPGRMLIGELDGGVSPRIERLRDHLRRAGIDAEAHPDIRVALWEKFVTICAFSGVTALTRLPLGPVTSCPETRAFCHGVLAEVAAVGRARGDALAETLADDALALLSQPQMAGLYGSMAHDLMAGRRLELETLNGTVVRLGGESGVATPCNFAVYAALKPYADGPPPVPAS